MLPNLAKKIRIASRDVKSFFLPDPLAEGIPSLRRTYRSTVSCSLMPSGGSTQGRFPEALSWIGGRISLRS